LHTEDAARPPCPLTDRVARLNTALEGRYSVESELGEGGMATVYLAEIETTANLQHPHPFPSTTRTRTLAAEEAPTPIVVENWMEEVKARVPKN